MINIDNLKILAETWMPADSQHVEFLNKKHPTLYQKLVDLVNTKKIVLDGLQINGKPAFRNCCSNVRLCLIQQKKYYHCFDCSSAQMAALCRNCFDLEEHRNHNWVYKEIKGKPYCQCGMTQKICPEVMCKSHNSIKRVQNPMNQQERQILLAFFTLYSKIIVNALFYKENCFVLYEKYIEYLKQFCRYSIDYIELTAQIMSTQFSKATQKTILVEILQKNKSKSVLNDNIFKLLTYLCNYSPFQYILNQSLFTASFQSRYDPHLKFYFKICDSPSVMNKLAENKIIIYNQDKKLNYNYSPIIEYYCQILQQYKWKNKIGILIPVWKYIKNELNLIKLLINSRNMGINSKQQKQLFMILQDCIPDFEFFQEIMAFFVAEWKYSEYQGYFSHSKFYNHVALVALKAVKANVSDVWIVFDKCDKQLLSRFFSFYFGQIFTDRKKCKFNNLTAKCFVSIINKFDLDCLNYVKLSQNIPLLKIGRILSIVLRNLTAYKHVQDLEILKIAKMFGNHEMVHQKQQRIFEWFQQYFFIKTQLNQNLIVAYKNRGILQIQKIKQFLMKKSLFSRGSKIFTYQGNEIDVHPDLLLQFLHLGEEACGIHDAENPEMFYTQSRLQVVTFIFEQAIQKVDFSKFQSHNKKDRYMICSTAIILNKMTRSQNPIFQKYVQKLKQLSKKMWRSNDAVDRLFQIRMYKPKQKMQLENEKLNQNKSQIKLSKMELIMVQQPTMKQEEMKIDEQKKQEQPKQEQQKQQRKVQVQVQVQVQEAKVEVEVKKQEQKQVQKIRQKSQQELLKQERKKKKINKIAQKYSSSSKKYLAFQVNQQHEKQVCLVCRQTLSDYGLLSYYGLLEKKTKGIIWKKYSNNKIKTCHFTMDSCFHAIHQKCCGNNNRKCILCTSPYDCFIPVVTKQLDQADQCVMTRMWWEQQFTQLIYKKFGKMSDFEVYISMFQSLVISISTMYLLPQKSAKTPQSKTQKWLYLLTHLYKIQTEQSKKQVQYQLKILLKQSEQVTDFINIIRIITSLAMLNKILVDQLVLQNVQIQSQMSINLIIVKLIDKAKLMFQIGYCQETFKHVEIIWGEKIGDLGFLKNVDIQVLWRELNLLGGLPQTVKELMNKRQVCKNCKLIQNYYCLGCDKVMCKNCVKLSPHIRQGCACIELQHASLYYFDNTTNKQESTAVYLNCFKQKYEQNAMDLDQYYIDTSIVNKIIEKILS